MQSFVCHRVPFVPLLLALALSGCFGSHGNERAADAGPRADSGFETDGAAPPLDAGPGPHPVDAGPFPSDGGLTCSDDRATLTCLSHVSAGTEARVGIVLGGDGRCFCGESVGCIAERGPDRTLSIRTAVCAGAILCDACFPFLEGQCVLPALEEGAWSVEINGRYAYSLDVLPAGVAPERGEVCIRSAADDHCGGPPNDPVVVDTVCHPSGAFAGERIPIRISDSCGGCGVTAGPCVAETFDDVIHVSPTRIEADCDADCAAVCEPEEHLCWTPPLEAGTYRVIVDGIDGYEPTITVGGGGDPTEVCGGGIAAGG